ncbi:hypothetical protein XELAEV_18029193mg [Xenopus laevis]|uniref:Uncharacterized protein n=1 Tax=Xenopus laevis TaxID=8355 RepID=A0A974CSX8_XENLA|nr:hypothetical protein XELAEV_18029193mg [Xenopus laevis]
MWWLAGPGTLWGQLLGIHLVLILLSGLVGKPGKTHSNDKNRCSLALVLLLGHGVHLQEKPLKCLIW